ncbi:MAG: hypothetical protein IJX24_03345, partial [Oscillospiraceae bacterium]|nr:hypothetical protein [Oscillospiraceae bacterium]
MNTVLKKHVTLVLLTFILSTLLGIGNVYAGGEDFTSDIEINVHYKKCTDSQDKVDVTKKTEYSVQEGVKVKFSPVLFANEIARIKYNGTSVAVW